MPSSSSKEQIEHAIADLEKQRALLGNDVVESAIAALRAQLAQQSPAATDSDDERKIVTVLFADISGFTQLAEGMDAEEARAVVNDCFEQLVPVIQRYGGTIDKFLGDAIMGLFGAPVAHENDAERALRAALDLIAALKSFNREKGFALGLHIGVNTGPVVAGAVGARGRKDYSVMGDAVNVAARLEDASGDDEILVGPETFRQCAALFDFETLPPMALKGKSQRLAVYRLITTKMAASGAQLVFSRTPLFGRDRELERIGSAIANLERGQGALICIVGEAGLGKSRLVAEARKFGCGAVWAETRALSYSETTSYLMARDLLHALLGTTADDEPGEIDNVLSESITAIAPGHFAEIYPYLGRVLEISLERTWSDQLALFSSEILQRRIWNAFRLYFEARASSAPLVLVWEDIHWADPSSLNILQELAPLVRASRIVSIVVYRAESSAHAWMKKLASEIPASHVHVMELAPLTAEQSSDFLIAGKIDNATTRQTILDRAEGNPFFLEELVRAVGDGSAAGTGAVSSIPQTLQAVLAARIDSLGKPAKRILQHAAIIGRTFPENVLARMCECEGEDAFALSGALEELCRRSFIQRVPVASFADYAFHHAVTHEVAYQSLLQARRRDLHRLAGEAIETLLPDRLEEFSGVLGHHFERAGVRGKAVECFVRAAQRARATFSNSEAITFYRAALSQTDAAAVAAESSRQLSLDLREGLGDVLCLNGEAEEARHEFTQAQKFAVASTPVTRSRLWRKVGSTCVMRREFDQTFECFSEAENALHLDDVTRDKEWWNEWALIQHERMHLFYWLGRCAELNALAATVQPELEKHGTVMQRGKFFMMRALSLLGEHRYLPPEIAVEYAQRAVDLTKDSTEFGELAHLKFALGFIQMWRVNSAAAISELARALQLSEMVGDLVLQARCLTYLAVAHRRANQVPEAEVFSQRALSIAMKLGLAQYTAMSRSTLAWIAWKNRDHSSVKEHATRALEEWHSMPDPYGFDWMALWPLVAVAVSERNFAEAVARLRDLFGPNQHPLPPEVTSSAETAIQLAKNRSGDLAQSIGHAIAAAHGAQQI